MPNVTLELILGTGELVITGKLYPIGTYNVHAISLTFTEVLDLDSNMTGVYQASLAAGPTGKYYCRVFSSAVFLAAKFVNLGTDATKTYRLVDQAFAADAAALQVTSQVGAGTRIFTGVVVKADGVTPLEDAEVWVTSDSAGQNVVAGTVYTNSAGQYTVYVDPGAYFVWVQSPTVNFNDSFPITVS
jgi:hypothetical protein